jgi:hypothetical protein
MARTTARSHRRTVASAIILSSLFAVSCGGMSYRLPTSPTAALPSATATTTLPAAPSPAPAAVQSGLTIAGAVGAVAAGAAPCWADRYACEVYDFTLAQSGAIEVTLTWEGQPRALMVQLYWAGEGLAHEDVAPRTGPARINFRRPLMEAASYRLRVVSLEPGSSIPFQLTLSY